MCARCQSGKKNSTCFVFLMRPTPGFCLIPLFGQQRATCKMMNDGNLYGSLQPRAAGSAIKPMNVGKTWILAFTKLFFDHSEFICHHLVTCKPRLINSGASRDFFLFKALLLAPPSDVESGEFLVSFRLKNLFHL